MGAQSHERGSLYRAELVYPVRPSDMQYQRNFTKCNHWCFSSLIALASKCRFKLLTCIKQPCEFSCLVTSYLVVLQNSVALLNSSSFCFSSSANNIGSPSLIGGLAVSFRPRTQSDLSEEPFRLIDLHGDIWLV